MYLTNNNAHREIVTMVCSVQCTTHKRTGKPFNVIVIGKLKKDFFCEQKQNTKLCTFQISISMARSGASFHREFRVNIEKQIQIRWTVSRNSSTTEKGTKTLLPTWKPGYEKNEEKNKCIYDWNNDPLNDILIISNE